MADYIDPDSLEYKLKLGRVPPEPQEGILWRGMSGGEYKNLLEQGFLASKGEYNIGESQKGLTIFSTNPRTAEMYAHDFAPRDFKATPESPAYVVGIRKPSDSVPQQGASGPEFGVRGQIPLENIIKVYRGNVFRPKSDTSRAVLDWQEVPVSSLGKPRPTDQPGPEEPTTPPGWSPYETPAGNLARNVPAVLEGVPLISEILRLWYDERLPEQRPEEPVRGRGLQTRQGKGQILRKIFRRVGKVNLPLRILDSVERYYSLLSPGQQEGLGEFLQTFAEHAGPTVIPPKVWEKIVGTVAKPQQGIASLGEAMGISEDDLLRNPWPVDDLPLTGAQRGELLNLYETRTQKSKPRNAVNDLVRNEYWPEELRSDGIAFLEGSAKFGSARQRRVYDQKPDPLASRQPGHAIRKFEAKKRHKLEEEARRSNEAAIRERGEALQGLDEEGLWNKKAVGEIASRMNLIEHMGIGYLQREIARANMEAVPRALKKEGWTVRYASKGRDKRRSSRYIVSPDRRFEVRLSDHYLPDTPEREYMHSQTGGPRWDEDIVVSGTESPRSIIDEIKDLYIKSVDDREGYVSGGFVDKPLYESARLIG